MRLKPSENKNAWWEAQSSSTSSSGGPTLAQVVSLDAPKETPPAPTKRTEDESGAQAYRYFHKKEEKEEEKPKPVTFP